MYMQTLSFSLSHSLSSLLSLLLSHSLSPSVSPSLSPSPSLPPSLINSLALPLPLPHFLPPSLSLLPLTSSFLHVHVHACTSLSPFIPPSSPLPPNRAIALWVAFVPLSTTPSPLTTFTNSPSS